MKSELAGINQLIITEDGSHSIFSGTFQCSYHSVKGAVTESRHIFIQQGLDYYAKKHENKGLSILEYGFGTGLNALLAYLYAKEKRLLIDYESIEAFPLDSKTVLELNYSGILGIEESEILKFHHPQSQMDLSPFFKLKLHKVKFEEFVAEKKYDIIFFDAFGPDDQPHLWERPFLDTISQLMHEGSIFVTYSVKGSFKRALKSLGFALEKLPGPPGKREILRAIKL
jgi:tRNA U34 5-methylaminomethyl-2-thiouridine-forming methyltransferase MnmC